MVATPAKPATMPPTNWKVMLGYTPADTLNTLQRKWRKLTLTAHPNRSGNRAAWDRLQKVWGAVQEMFQKYDTRIAGAQTALSRNPTNSAAMAALNTLAKSPNVPNVLRAKARRLLEGNAARASAVKKKSVNAVERAVSGQIKQLSKVPPGVLGKLRQRIQAELNTIARNFPAAATRLKAEADAALASRTQGLAALQTNLQKARVALQVLGTSLQARNVQRARQAHAELARHTMAVTASAQATSNMITQAKVLQRNAREAYGVPLKMLSKVVGAARTASVNQSPRLLANAAKIEAVLSVAPADVKQRAEKLLAELKSIQIRRAQQAQQAHAAQQAQQAQPQLKRKLSDSFQPTSPRGVFNARAPGFKRRRG